MYIITARRMTSGELLKYRKGLRIAGGYGTPLAGSSQFALTKPLRAMPSSVSDHMRFEWSITSLANCRGRPYSAVDFHLLSFASLSWRSPILARKRLDGATQPTSACA